jgi:hypothetical protein
MRRRKRKMGIRVGIRLWRRRWESNPRIRVLQTLPLATWVRRLACVIIPQIARAGFKGAIKRRVAVKGEQSLPPPRKEGELVPI